MNSLLVLYEYQSKRNTNLELGDEKVKKRKRKKAGESGRKKIEKEIE